MLRGIDRHLDLTNLRRSLKPFYSRIGRPSVDPELMIRMLIVGYCLRSESAALHQNGFQVASCVNFR
jgi:hypothetical protein